VDLDHLGCRSGSSGVTRLDRRLLEILAVPPMWNSASSLRAWLADRLAAMTPTARPSSTSLPVARSRP